MEDILDVYEKPFDPLRPVICMDEKLYQLLGEAKERFPMKKGSNLEIDFEYTRQSTCSIFVFTQPLGCIRHVSVRARRTSIDWAEEIKYLCDVTYPDAEKSFLVLDNLNTHKISSLYKAFPAPEACRIAKRLEIHHIPKHGSWLNIAEIELNVMTRQCLNRCIDNIDRLRLELSSWERKRNSDTAKINWHFTNDHARTKLISLYPKTILSS